MATLSTVIFISALAAVCVAVIPENYTLKVTPFCGKGAVEDARIEIITDLVIKARVECAGGVTVQFTTEDDVNFKTHVSYPGQGNQACVFTKQPNSMVFVVKVVAAYGEGPRFIGPGPRDPLVMARNMGSSVNNATDQRPGLVHMQEEEWLVTCSFGDMGRGLVNKTVIDGCIAPAELFQNVGPLSDSSFDLDLVDVVGRSLHQQDVHLGRTVQLRGVSKGPGVRPTSCFALDGGVAKYAILRAGCGDGIVFRKDRGFITKGSETLSPYFLAFDINFTNNVTFSCHFVECTPNCDGSSCPLERKRRSTACLLSGDMAACGDAPLRSTDKSQYHEEFNFLSRLIRRREV